MTLIADCVACRYGNHEDHVDWPKKHIKGLIGSGQQCPCKGECEGRTDTFQTQMIEAMRQLMEQVE